MADESAADDGGQSMANAKVARLFEQHADAVEAVARGLTRDAHLAADICQSVFAKALSKLPEIPSGAERAWLLRVSKNEAIDVLRKRGRERKHSRAAALPLPLNANEGEQSVFETERAHRIREVIAELPAFDREIVKRRFELGQTFAVIADETKKPLGTVLSRAHRLMKTLELRLRSLSDPDEADDDLQL